MRFPFIAFVAVAVLSAINVPSAQTRPIDTQTSTLTVFVYKSGLFAALGDNHVISAPIADGSFSDGEPPQVELSITAADLVVTDPGVSPDRRTEIRARMLGADVLDVARFPRITFASTSIEQTEPDRWRVSGRLSLHGHTRDVAFTVARTLSRYRGAVTIRQRDYGIEPVSVAGGAVKVKDEVRIAFDVADSRAASTHKEK